MLRTAMLNRPELREVSYQQRINEHEADAALIERLPGFDDLFGAARLIPTLFVASNPFAEFEHVLDANASCGEGAAAAR